MAVLVNARLASKRLSVRASIGWKLPFGAVVRFLLATDSDISIAGINQNAMPQLALSLDLPAPEKFQ